MSSLLSSSGKKMIVLKSSDRETFEIEEKAAQLSKTLEDMIKENYTDTMILLPLIKASDRHAEAKPAFYSEGQCAWDADFVNIDLAVLSDILVAANFLDIPDLLNLSVQRVAEIIKGKTPEEIHKFFNIEKDYTPEEEEHCRGENRRAFD